MFRATIHIQEYIDESFIDIFEIKKIYRSADDLRKIRDEFNKQVDKFIEENKK